MIAFLCSRHNRQNPRLELVLTCAALFFGNLRLVAQAAPTPDPTAVLAHVLAALSEGGTSASDLTMKGRVDFIAGSTQDTGDIVFRALYGGYSSMVITRPTEVMQEIRRNDPDRLSGTTVDASGTRPLDGKNLLRPPYWFSPELFTKSLSTPAWSLIDEQPTTVNRIAAVDLTLQRAVTSNTPLAQLIKRESTLHLVIDSLSHRVLTISYREASPRAHFSGPAILYEYDQYTPVQGHMMPMHITRRVNGSVNLDIRLTSSSFDEGLSADSFQLK